MAEMRIAAGTTPAAAPAWVQAAAATSNVKNAQAAASVGDAAAAALAAKNAIVNAANAQAAAARTMAPVDRDSAVVATGAANKAVDIAIASAQGKGVGIPPWAWLVGGGAVLMFLATRRRSPVRRSR